MALQSRRELAVWQNAVFLADECYGLVWNEVWGMWCGESERWRCKATRS
jgi:hypothetical protein